MSRKTLFLASFLSAQIFTFTTATFHNTKILYSISFTGMDESSAVLSSHLERFCLDLLFTFHTLVGLLIDHLSIGSHMHRIFRDLSPFFIADTIPSCSNISVSKYRTHLFKGAALCLREAIRSQPCPDPGIEKNSQEVDDGYVYRRRAYEDKVNWEIMSAYPVLEM